MRLDVRDKEFAAIVNAGGSVRVFLDGDEIKHGVTMADEEQGVVLVLLRNMPVHEEYGPARAVFTGRVEIRVGPPVREVA